MKGAGRGSTSGDGVKGISTPSKFEGDQHRYAEWEAKVLAYLRAGVHRNADQWIACAGEHGQPIVDDDVLRRRSRGE